MIHTKPGSYLKGELAVWKVDSVVEGDAAKGL